MKRSRRGFTLIEMVVAIAASAFVFAAGTLLVVSSIRMQNHIIGDASRGNDARVVLTLIEKLASEGVIAPPKVEGNVITLKNGSGGSDATILKYDGDKRAIYVGNSGAPLMENVQDFKADVDGQLLEVEFEAGGEQFQTSVFCCSWVPELSEIKTTLNSLVSLNEQEKKGRYEFISTAYEQLGSSGTFVDSSGEETPYSLWYCNGSYPQDWNENTPWCGCFVSWCIEQLQVAGLLDYDAGSDDPPKFATVGDGVTQFGGAYKLRAEVQTEDILPGDVIFFNTDTDADADHTGIVLQVTDEVIYTIEGNRNGRVAFGTYPADDPRIVGFGRLEWKTGD